MQKRIFALGFFDGVHLGHQQLLKACAAMAERQNAQAAAITFLSHPQSLFCETVPPLINTHEDRLRLLQRYGIGPVYSFPVTEEVMSTSWQDFLAELEEYGAAGFVCGDDFRFGRRGEGNGEKLQQYCREKGFPCRIIPQQTLDGVRISSTHIRGLLEQGQLEEAVRFLGHPHILTGAVVSGRHLGRRLGVPTANLHLPEDLVCPKHGVYACRAWVGETAYVAVTNIGTRPTVNGKGVTVEAWLLGYTGDLYGKSVTLEFHRYLRGEEAFSSLEALKAQIQKDKEKTLEIFENP